MTEAFKWIKIPQWSWWLLTSGLLFVGGAWGNAEKESINSKFETQRAAVDAIDVKATKLEERADEVDETQVWMDREMAVLKNNLSHIDRQLDSMEKKLDRLIIEAR